MALSGPGLSLILFESCFEGEPEVTLIKYSFLLWKLWPRSLYLAGLYVLKGFSQLKSFYGSVISLSLRDSSGMQRKLLFNRDHNHSQFKMQKISLIH